VGGFSSLAGTKLYQFSEDGDASLALLTLFLDFRNVNVAPFRNEGERLVGSNITPNFTFSFPVKVKGRMGEISESLFQVQPHGFLVYF